MLNCQQANEKLSKLQILQAELGQALELASNPASHPQDAKKALATAQGIRIKLEAGILELFSQLELRITVPDAENPYRNALVKAGLKGDRPECADKKEITFDLEKTVTEQCDRYASQGLNEWAEDIKASYDNLEKKLLDSEEQRKTRLRIKEGMIPIVMPGRAVQQATWRNALSLLRPDVGDLTTKSGPQPPFSFISVLVEYREKMHSRTDARQPATFFDCVPEQSYIMWTKPTHRPAPYTNNLNFKQQVQKLAELHSETPDLVDATDIIPTEYAALQSVFTHNVINYGRDTRLLAKMTTVPLDANVSSTRFLSAGVFPRKRVVKNFLRRIFVAHGDIVPFEDRERVPQVAVSYDNEISDFVYNIGLTKTSEEGIGFRTVARS